MTQVKEAVRVRYAPGPTDSGQPGTDRRGPALAGHGLGRDPAGPIGAQGALPTGRQRTAGIGHGLSLLLYAATARADARRAAGPTRAGTLRSPLPLHPQR